MWMGTCAVWFLGLPGAAHADERSWTLWVDDDDDDGNGVADRLDTVLPAPKATSTLEERGALEGRKVAIPKETKLRLFLAERFVSSGAVKRTAPSGPPVWLQGAAVGRWAFRTDDQPATAIVLRAYRVAGGKWSAPLFGSVSRERPGAWGEGADPEAFALGVRAPEGALPKELWLRSYSVTNRELDLRGPLAIEPQGCPGSEKGTECGVTEAVRLVATSVDRAHPSAGNALRVELGGRVELDVSKHPGDRSARQELHVVAPTQGDQGGRLGQVHFRVHVLRQGQGGAPAVGGNSEGAKRVVQRELRDSAALWAQCGIGFEVERLEVVDPPPTAVSAGGSLSLKLGKQRLDMSWPAGLDPRRLAHRIRVAIEKLGYRVELSDNGKSGYSDLPTVDLLVRKKDKSGALVELSSVQDGERQLPLSSDRQLPICLGEVALRDGLDHFNDFNAGSGTLEERSLVKALQDDDPGSIELFVVPSFVNSGRIGESFIYTAGASLRNVLIVDRAGIRAGSRSYVLAHELGHVLLDMPGHPDDFGVDDPGRLMDSDASEASVFGPRRLSLSDCRRVWSQSGGAAPLPLVREVPSHLPTRLVEEPAAN